MNRTHRIVWSESRRAFVVASELAKANGKPAATRKALALAVLAALGSLAAMPALAASSCPGGGTLITVSGAETSQCTLANNDSLTVTNSGSINASTGVFVNNVTVGSITTNTGGSISGFFGIRLTNGSSVGSITNSGTISGNFAGIYVNDGSSVGGITNSGSISGGSNGLRLSSSTVTDDISNSGSISGGSNGIYLSSSSVGSITNSGSISGGSNGIYLRSSTVTGDISNSGSISGIYLRSSTVTGSITNSGSISGGSNDIYLSSSTVTGSISNSGSISGGSTGIYIDNSTVTGGISNSGSISGGSNGIRLSSSTVTGDISNSGSISGGTAGIYLSNSSAGSISNSGSISGGTAGISLSSSTVTGSITNSGTISGGTNAIRVSADSTLANLDIGGNNTASFVGAVSAANTAMSILSGATYTLNTADDFTVASFTNNGTARFAAGVASSFDLSNVTGNTFTNNGVLEVGAGGTGTITGDYTQTASGIFQTTASSGTSFGKLAVSGTATLAAGTGIKVNAASGNTLAAGNTLASVISAGTLSASTFTVSDNSFLFDFSASVNGNAVDILTNVAVFPEPEPDTGTDTDTDTGNPSSGGVANAIAQTGFSSGRGAAVVLDGFVSGGTTGTDMDNVVTALGQLSTAQEVSDAVAETLPLLTAGMNQVALNAMHGTNRVIQSRQASNLGMSSGDEFLGDSTLWLKPVGSWATQDTHESVAGFDAVSHGLIGGLDGKISDDTRIGVALAWMHSNVDGKSTSSGNSADIDAYQAILYGSHNLSAMPDTTLDWQADIGTNQNKGQRVIGFMDRVATSDYDSLTAHLGAGLSRDFQVSEQTTLTPGIRADYTWIRDEGYTETGAGALNLKVKQRSTDELILLAEGSVAQSLTDRTKLLANLGVGYDVLNGQNSLTSSYVGGGTAFATQGLDASPWLARGGVGLVVKSTQNTEITARYDVETREDFLAQTASLNVRWDF